MGDFFEGFLTMAGLGFVMLVIVLAIMGLVIGPTERGCRHVVSNAEGPIACVEQ